MPHASAVAGGDDLASADEVKVYKDEGDDENRASENLSEDKIVLVTETEEDKRLEDGENGSSIGSVAGSKLRGVSGAGSTLSGSGFLDFSTGLPPPPFGSAYPWIAPYPPPGAGSPSAATAAAAVAMAAGLGRLPGPHASGLGLYLYGSDPLSQPPPAHMGIPPLHIDRIKTGLSRPPTINPLSTPYNPLLYPFYAPDFSKCWSSLAGYRLPSAFPTPYPPLPGSPLSPFGPASAAGLFTPPPLSPTSKRHPHASSLSSRSVGMSPSPSRDLFQMPGSHVDTPRRLLMGHRRSEYGSTGVPSPPEPLPQPSPRRPVIKKPLNAFMLFMKEMRQKVIDECTLKESAAINQILGRKWHALDKAEQAKYYEMARKEKELHMQLYPGWSARDNYGMHSKKKRKLFGRDDQGMKKCHSRFNSSEEGPWYPSVRSDSDSERSCSSGTMNTLSTVSLVNSTALTSAPGL